MVIGSDKEKFENDMFLDFCDRVKNFAMDEDGQVHVGFFKVILLVIQILQVIYKLKK